MILWLVGKEAMHHQSRYHEGEVESGRECGGREGWTSSFKNSPGRGNKRQSKISKKPHPETKDQALSYLKQIKEHWKSN